MKLPEVATGVLIYNGKKEIFLATGEKFGRLWTVPGGHLEFGESLAECAKREVEEETGYEIVNLQFALVQESIFEDDRPEKHYIFVNYFAALSGGEFRLEGSEFDKSGWFSAQKALSMNLNNSTRALVIKFQEKFNL